MRQFPARQVIELGHHRQRLSYFEAGAGADILLVHGALTTSHDMVLTLFDALSPKYRLIAIDRPGHGLSTRRRFAGSPQTQARVLMEGARALGLRRPVVLGHSMGATVAVHIALAFPEEIAGVVAIAPLAFPEPRLETLLFGPRGLPGLGDIVAPFSHVGPDVSLLPLLWPAMFLPQSMPESFRENFPFAEVSTGKALQASGEDALQTPLGLFESAGRYSACRTPMHIIAGSADAVVNTALHAVPLSKALPCAELQIVEGMGHMLHHFEAEMISEACDQLAGPLSSTLAHKKSPGREARAS